MSVETTNADASIQDTDGRFQTDVLDTFHHHPKHQMRCYFMFLLKDFYL